MVPWNEILVLFQDMNCHEKEFVAIRVIRSLTLRLFLVEVEKLRPMPLGKLCICFVFLFSFACSDDDSAAQKFSDNLSKEEVIAFLRAYDSAWNTKNHKVVDSLYASQYRYFTSVGGISSRARNLEILAADYYKVIAAERTEVDISIDEDIAIVSSRWQGRGIWKDEPFNDNQRCGLIIQKKGKELKLLSEHCVDISGEPSF